MTSDTNTSQSPEPLAILRDYELLRRLGQGGMGSVYLARHSHLDKRVAIKLLPPEHLRNPEMVARFKREMKAVGKLQHPNIIQAFDGGEEKRIHFLVLEYAEGLDLSMLLARYGAVPVSDACEIIRQAAVGLEHAHLHGLVHRDVKPANLLLAWPAGGTATPSDGEDSDAGISEPLETVEWDTVGRLSESSLSADPHNSPSRASGLSMQPVVKVLDLGLALLNDDTHSIANGLTGTGQIMGTLDYMAPEQTSDTHTVDIRADIYSLGCTLYALLTGAPPFAGEAYTNPYQKIVAHNQESPRPLHEVRENVPPQVVAILNKMLAKNPDDRFATPIEVAAALKPFCANNTLLSTLVEAEARQADHKARSDAATQELNSSAMQGTTTGRDAADLLLAADDELLELLRSTTAIDETIVSKSAGNTAETQFRLNIAAKPTVKQVRQTRARDSSRLRIHLLAAAACLVVGLLIAAVVFRIMTNYGTIELTLYHKDAQVTVGGDAIRLRPSQEDDRYLIRLTPGRHKLQIEKDGYTTFTRDIEIDKGENKLVGVQLLRLGQSTVGRPSESSRTGNVNDSESRATVSPRPPPSMTAAFNEPPPLEEWLEGREILTVKQDGSAMFTKIQDALDALNPGQVVEVLDKGPYRETLDRRFPEDSGLISQGGSQIVIDEWRELDGDPSYEFFGHFLTGHFRLHGFGLFSDSVNNAILLRLADNATIEECVFPNVSSSQLRQRSLSYTVLDPAHPVVIRDCAFGSNVYLGLYGGATRVLVERNYFRSDEISLGIGCFKANEHAHLAILRRNIFSESTTAAMTTAAVGSPSNLQARFERNTVLSRYQLLFVGSLPDAPFDVRGNLVTTQQGIMLTNDAEQRAELADAKFVREGNLFAVAPSDANSLPLSATDVLGKPVFLSKEPTSPDYARLDPKSLPEPTDRYGALPPGPAPPEGDWFTRLQERWIEAQEDLKRMGLAEGDETMQSPTVGRLSESSPATSKPSRPQDDHDSESRATVKEPPSLDQWLVGREILTVKQDGSAMFTKIQDAFDAVKKPGQVVEVLDKGPYLERLTVEDRIGGGLVSRVGTTVKPPAYERGEMNGKPLLTAHRLYRSPDFRFHGLRFLFSGNTRIRGIHTNNTGLVFEECVFVFDQPTETSSGTGHEASTLR